MSGVSVQQHEHTEPQTNVFTASLQLTALQGLRSKASRVKGDLTWLPYACSSIHASIERQLSVFAVTGMTDSFAQLEGIVK